MTSGIKDIDTDPLVRILFKVSGGRLINDSVKYREEDFHTLQIPVIEQNPNDKTDRVLRKYARDWILNNLEEVGVETSFEKLARGTSFFTQDKEIPVYACLKITWWHKRKQTDLEELKEKQEKWKGTRPD